jgi:hypothetical protein
VLFVVPSEEFDDLFSEGGDTAIFLHGKENSSADPSSFRLSIPSVGDCGEGSMLTRLSHSSMGEGIPWIVSGRYGSQGMLRASTWSRDKESGVAGLEGEGEGVGTAASERRALSGAEEARPASLAGALFAEHTQREVLGGRARGDAHSARKGVKIT